MFYIYPDLISESCFIDFQATLKVDNVQRIMIFGQSKDLGTCKSTKKSGEKCTAFVNTNRCEYCIYHVKQEYQKCSRRSELQSNFAGRGLIALRNKVLGKNEVFYAGKSYTAIPASKSKKLTQKDDNRLKLLSGATVSSSAGAKSRASQAKVKKHAAQVEASKNQRKRDLDILKKLGGLGESKSLDSDFAAEAFSTNVTLVESKQKALDVISKLKAKQKSGSNCDSKEVKITGNEIEAKDGVDKEKKAENNVALKQQAIKETEFGEIDLSVDYKVGRSVSKPGEKRDILVETKPKADVGIKDEKIDFGVDCTIKGVCDKKVDVSSVNPRGSVPDGKTQNRNLPNLSDNTESAKLPENIINSVPSPGNFIDLSAPLPKRKANRAMSSALKYIQKNGPIQKRDPNSTKRGGGQKRVSVDPDEAERDAKRQKIQENEFYSEKFKKMMAMTSRNADLLEARDDEERGKYFDKMEMRERMEEKMTSTYKVPCKAVRCLQCKYTSFSAADRCKTERHPLKVADAVKRFFKCGDCGNRTVCLEVVPVKPCANCGSGKWERTTMMKERRVGVSHGLSIRGGEQKFVNSTVADANINLLVPED